MSETRGLIVEALTDQSIELMRRRIGYPNPTLRETLDLGPWNRVACEDAFRRFSICIGDNNPLYTNPDYAAASRWQGSIAPVGFEMTMGINMSRTMTPAFQAETRKALRGVHLFNSGTNNFYYRPIRPADQLFKSAWVASVEEKASKFANKSVLVTNEDQAWNQNGEVVTAGARCFIHTERKQASDTGGKYAKDQPPFYTDEQLQEIEDAYDNEYVRGADTLYIEDCEVGQELPRMAKGPLTVTDLINYHMAAGWKPYGNYPFRLAYEARKGARAFYTRDEFNAWDTLQRIHWEPALARQVGVQTSYDIGPMRFSMLAHYLMNFAGDDAWIYYIRSEYRSFNYIGDVTWLTGRITAVRRDEILGPLIEIDVQGISQRGAENLRGKAIILVASKATGLAQLPPAPTITPYKRKKA
jgi:acyl dehydratase